LVRDHALLEKGAVGVVLRAKVWTIDGEFK